MKTRHEILMEEPEYRKLYAIEGLVTDAAELVARLMREKGVKKAELARRLGKSRAWVTQLLSGKANMTIRTFAEVAYALGAKVKVSTQPEVIQQDTTSLLQWCAAVFEAPYFGNPWKIQPKFEFAYGDLPRSVWAKNDQDVGAERGFAA